MMAIRARVKWPAFLFSAIAMVAGCGGDTRAPETEIATTTAPADLPEGAWQIDYAASRLGFSATQNGEAFEGGFEDWQATILFDPDDLAASRIDVTINTASAETGDRQRDDALPNADWFETKAYPAARFFADDITRKAAGAYEAYGVLTIRDIAKPVTLPFSLVIDDNMASANGEVVIDRTVFGVGRGEDFDDGTWVGTGVIVQVAIIARR